MLAPAASVGKKMPPTAAEGPPGLAAGGAHDKRLQLVHAVHH